MLNVPELKNKAVLLVFLCLNQTQHRSVPQNQRQLELMVSDNVSVPFRFNPRRFRIRELKMTNGLDFLKTVTHGLHETDRQ